MRQIIPGGKPLTAREHLTSAKGVSALSDTAALLLIGHGSARYPDAADPMQRHAAALRDRWPGQVAVAALNGAPTPRDALAVIADAVIRVVPFFMEDGYFTRVAIPRAMNTETRRIIRCPPIGVHDAMAGIIERQALAGCADLALPPHAVAVVVVGHGSATTPGRALALHRHAATVASTRRFARVEAACLEEAPFLADTLAELRAHAVVMIGFFANRGGHVRDDLPAIIAAEHAGRGNTGHPVRLQGCVVDDPALVRVVLDQASGA